MKRICWILSVFLTLSLLLAGCNGKEGSVTAQGTTVPPAKQEPAPVIVLPLTRSANSQYDAGYCRVDQSLLELWESADAVARISVGNWLSETEHGSYYDATVLRCYKGDLPASIVLEQAGSSQKSYADFPLFIYGNEFLVFLQNWDADALSAVGPYGGVDDLPIFDPSVPDLDSPEHTPTEPDHITEEDQVMPIPEEDDETDGFLSGPINTIPPEFTDIIIDEPLILPVPELRPPPETEPEPEPEPPYENCYQIVEGGALMDCATGIDGNVYLLDRYYLVDPHIGLTATTQRPSAEVTEDFLRIFSLRDAYCHNLFKGRILYRLADVLDYLENPPPEPEEE